MRAFLCLPLLFLAACDTAGEPLSEDRTALQIRINDPGVERLTKRFARTQTDASVGVFPEECGGAFVLTFTGRNEMGEALRMRARVDTDGALEVPFTVDVSQSIEGSVSYSGGLPGGRADADNVDFTVARGVLSLIESTPRRAQGAIQVSGGARGLDMDATAAFDEVPSVLDCDDA